MFQKLQIRTQTMNKCYGKFKDSIILLHFPSACSSQRSGPTECHAMWGAQISCIQLRLAATQFWKLWTNFCRIHPAAVHNIKNWYGIHLSKLWTIKQRLPRPYVQGTSRYAGWCGSGRAQRIVSRWDTQTGATTGLLYKCLLWFLLFHNYHPWLSSNRFQLHMPHTLHNFLSEEDVPTWCKQFYYDFFS